MIFEQQAIAALRLIVSSWNEFGPEHLDELIWGAERLLAQASEPTAKIEGKDELPPLPELPPEFINHEDYDVIVEYALAYGRQCFDAARKAPDGWQLVPKEPTFEMQQAAADYLNACVKARGLWEAMLAAAPKQGDGNAES